MARWAWLCLALAGCALGPVPGAAPPRAAPYQGWREALFLEAKEAGISMIAVPSAGGRIISFALREENILFENPDYLGKTLTDTPPDKLSQGYIGYNIDLGPELRRIPPHLLLWMGSYAWSGESQATRLTSEADPAVGIRIEKELRLDPISGALHLVQTMKNVSGKEQAYCLWDRTLCKGGGFALVPLGTKSRFKDGWSLLKNGVYSGDSPSHLQVSVIRGVLVARAQGTSTKLGVDSDAGWIAYVRGKLLFIKYFPVFREGSYTDGGNSVEVYFDPKVCELEPLSPERTLKPDEIYSFPEIWKILELDQEVTDANQARALVDRIAPSPFLR
jgi:hypothetical protein